MALDSRWHEAFVRHFGAEAASHKPPSTAWHSHTLAQLRFTDGDAAHAAFGRAAVQTVLATAGDALSSVAELVLDGDADTAAYQLERLASRSDVAYDVRRDERSLLLFAAYARSRATVELLLNCGVDVNERDLVTGHTPLHAALFVGSLELLTLLAEHGADPLLEDEFGASLLDWARLLSLTPALARTPDRRIAVRDAAPAGACVRLVSLADFERQFDLAFVDSTLADLSYVLELAFSCQKLAEPDLDFRRRYAHVMWRPLSDPRDLVVAFVDERVGHGLFAGRVFHAGEYVCRYGGVARSDDVVTDRRYAVVSGIDGCTIDGSRARSLGCFINHCSRPNVALESIFEHGVEELMVIACRDIARGEQLLNDYTQQYFDDDGAQTAVDLFGSRIQLD